MAKALTFAQGSEALWKHPRESSHGVFMRDVNLPSGLSIAEALRASHRSSMLFMLSLIWGGILKSLQITPPISAWIGFLKKDIGVLSSLKKSPRMVDFDSERSPR